MKERLVAEFGSGASVSFDAMSIVPGVRAVFVVDETVTLTFAHLDLPADSEIVIRVKR